MQTAWSVGFKKATKVLKSYDYNDNELDLSSYRTITMLKPFGEKLEDVMLDEEDDSVEETIEIIENLLNDSDSAVEAPRAKNIENWLNKLNPDRNILGSRTLNFVVFLHRYILQNAAHDHVYFLFIAITNENVFPWSGMGNNSLHNC